MGFKEYMLEVIGKEKQKWEFTHIGTGNWFNTLSQALEAEGLEDTWEIHFSPINYGQTFKYSFQIPNEYSTKSGKPKKPKFHHVSISRDDRGMYERPIHYSL